MRPLFILIFVCLYCGKLCGQSFYVSDNNGKFQKITITNGQLGPATPIPGCLRSNTAQSIAFQNGVMYYIDASQLWKADLVSDALINCQLIGPMQPFLGLTIDKKGILYLTAGNSLLYTYDPKTKGSLVLKGTLPEAPSADMIFYKDELYVSTKKGILKVNIQDPSKSVLVIPTGELVLGLAVVSVNSTVNKVYALESNASLTNTTIVELDLDNYRIGASLGQLGYFVFDAASNVEDGSYVALNIDDIKTTPDCPANGRGTVQVIVSNANSNYRYTLGNVTNSTGIFNGVSPGDHTVTIANGAESKQTPVTIGQFQVAKPQLTVTPKDPTCLDKGNVSITTNADADKYTIVFQGNSYPLNNTFVLNAGKYHFDIQNLNGCVVDFSDVTLTRQTCEIVLNEVKQEQDCNQPQKTTVTAITTPGTDKYYYTLDGGAQNTTGVFNNVAAGDHQLKITSDGGGVREVTVKVNDLSLNDPKVTHVKNDAKCGVAGSVKFSVGTGNMSGYTVMFRSATYPIDKEILLPDSGTYNFKLMKPGGCLLKDETIKITKQACEVVFFPNTFTPNNDGINDIFRPVDGTTAEKLKFRIFNRLGTMIYTSENTKTGWDGTFQGKPAPAGVYYWTASYINNEGSKTAQNGSIALIR